MLNPRESIEYHNRKFQLVFTGTSGDGVWDFDISNPPNEFAYSDRYSQCLIQITKAHLNNRGDTTNLGLDAQFTDQATGTRVEPCESGVMLLTDLKTNNKRQYFDNKSSSTQQGIFCMLQNKFGSAGEGGAFAGTDVNCATLVERGQAAAGAGGKGANANLHSVAAWEYIDHRPIEDGGVLCGNPFGRKFKCQLYSTNSEAPVKLTSEANFNQAASNGSSLCLEIDVLMLPNPTSGGGR